MYKMNVFMQAAGIKETLKNNSNIIGGCLSQDENETVTDYLIKKGFQTRSDFVRECIKYYMENHKEE